MLLAALVLAAAADPGAVSVRVGEITDPIVCTANPKRSYALFLPFARGGQLRAGADGGQRGAKVGRVAGQAFYKGAACMAVVGLCRVLDGVRECARVRVVVQNIPNAMGSIATGHVKEPHFLPGLDDVAPGGHAGSNRELAIR